MNGLKVLDDETVPPQMFIYGCVLESGKEVKFCPDDDGFEHLLDLRMACTDLTTKDELHLVEVEGKDCDGQKVTATLASLKPSTLPSVSLGGFSIPPPAVLRLKCGAGPIHISGQYLVSMDYNRLRDDDDDDDDDDDGEEEEEEEEEEEDVKVSKKRPAASPASKSQKKMKMDVHMDEDDDDDDDDYDDDDEEEEEETPVKAKPVRKSTQNGKSPKANPSTPKQVKTPKQKVGKSPKSPTTPKETLPLPEIQAKMAEAVKKGVALPKAQPKFENFVKNSFRVSDAKVVAELWKWRQTVADPK